MFVSPRAPIFERAIYEQYITLDILLTYLATNLNTGGGVALEKVAEILYVQPHRLILVV